MTARETSDAEMLAAVERWARARGWWGWTDERPSPSRAKGWHLHCAGKLIAVWLDGREYASVDPHTALLWACTVETTETLTSPPMGSDDDANAWVRARTLDPVSTFYTFDDESSGVVARVTRPLAVDVGKCPACAGDGVNRRQEPAEGVVLRFECPDCNGTGRDLLEIARLVLDAAPRERIESDLVDVHVLAWLIMQDRAVLHVEADRMLPDLEGKRPHDPERERLGEWLALWLAGKDDAAGEMVAWLRERQPATADTYYGEISGTVLR